MCELCLSGANKELVWRFFEQQLKTQKDLIWVISQLKQLLCFVLFL